MTEDTKRKAAGQLSVQLSETPIRGIHRQWALPEPSLSHLIRLTDDTGLFQHAKFTIPNRAHGYCTDDNARGAIAMVKHYALYGDPQALRLLDTYLAFVMHAQNPDGTIRNFLDFHRRWWDDEPAHDGFGRALWALGATLAHPPAPQYLPVMKNCFDRATGHIQHQSNRGMAYCILGLCDYLKQFPGVRDIQRHVERAADSLIGRYRQTRADDWRWFEDFFTYDNAVLPHALFVAGLTLRNEEWIETARETTEFLLRTTWRDDHFSFVGTHGWYERGKSPAPFDQQPVEAAALVMMLRAAYDATRESRFLELQRAAFNWLLGANDLGIPLYDFRTKGCSDGLMAGGINGNQGAESMISFLLSLLSIRDSYATTERVQAVSLPLAPAASRPEGIVAQPHGLPTADKDAVHSRMGEPT